MGAHRRYRTRNYAFGSQLLALRTRAALTQLALAEQIGVHRRSVQNWETGESYPKAATLGRLIAVLLRHQAFTAGQERAEARALWLQAAQHAPYALGAFDEGWFAQLLAADAPAAPVDDPRPVAASAAPAPPRAIIDWGEAIAVPTLYGREQELATLQQWVLADRCRTVSIVGLGGIGKSSLALTFAQRVLEQFDTVVFRSLQNGPPLAGLLDQIIRAISGQQTPPAAIHDKIALLVQCLRGRRCLLILDNLETIMQPAAPTGTYRPGYAEYGELLLRLSERSHQSCLLLTSREKTAELAPLEGRSAPVRTLPLGGLADCACQIILKTKEVSGTPRDVQALAQLYGGNPLALTLVAEPIRELFGGDLGAFLATGDAFFNGVGTLLDQQFARATPLEQTILYWLAIARDLLPFSALVAALGEAVPQRAVLVALESLRRRMQIERSPDRPAFTLQPVILEYVTDRLVETAAQQLLAGQTELVQRHALIQATAREDIRRSQERLIALPLLKRLSRATGDAAAAERLLLVRLATWRDQPAAAQGYGPGSLINLLRLLRGHLRGLDLARLVIRQASFQGIEAQGASLAGATVQDCSFTEPFDVMGAVAISANGAYWAAASRRGELRVWVDGGQTLHRMWRGHADQIPPGALAFSPDGSTLVSGSTDGTIKLWEVASGTLRWSGTHSGFVHHVAIAPDGRTLVSLASGDSPEATLWETAHGSRLPPLQHPSTPTAIAWSPDGLLLASGDIEGAVRLWEPSAGAPATCRQTLTGHSAVVVRLAFAPDASTLASASWDGTLKLWDTDSGRLLQTLTGHTDRVNRVAWSPDGQTIASAGRDCTVRLWEVGQGRCRALLQSHTAEVWSLAFTPDSRSLLSSSEDGTLRVWDTASEQCVRVKQGHAVTLYDLDWSPDGRQLICGGSDGLLTRWDAEAGAPPRVVPGCSTMVCRVGWSPTGRWFASSEWDGTLRLWQPASEECQMLRPAGPTANFCYGLAWSPDGQRLASATFQRGVQLFDLATQRQHWLPPEAATWLSNLAWAADGMLLAGGSDDGSVYVWDTHSHRLLLQLVGHQGMITGVAWSPNGARLVSGGGGNAGGELFVWDVERGECIERLAAQAGSLHAVTWASAELVVSGGNDGALRWWNLRQGRCVRVCAAHQGTVQALKCSPDGSRLASCGDDGAIMLWDLHSGAWLQTLRRDRPYERLAISGLAGITAAQHSGLLALGAADERPEARG